MPSSDTSSLASSSSSSAFSFDEQQQEQPIRQRPPPPPPTTPSSSVFSKLAITMRDTRHKVEQKRTELNATVHERLPEWRSRGMMYSNLARETGLEWSRKGKEAVDRWREKRLQNQDFDDLGAFHLFGSPLDQAIVYTCLSDADPLPGILRRCIDYLDVHGTEEVGIYRVPGSTTVVNKLKMIFDKGDDCDFFTTFPDTNAVATLLKMYLRELPDQLIPEDINDQYKSHLTIYTKQHASPNSDLPPITTELLEVIADITTQLPVDSHYLLSCLSRHLHHIAARQDENKMSTSNLALIFIPTLGISRLLFHCMVDHHTVVFKPLATLSSAGPIASPARASPSLPPPLPTSALRQPPPPLPVKPRHIQSPTISTVPTKPARSHRPSVANKSIDLGKLALASQHSRNSSPQPFDSPQPSPQLQHAKTLSDTELLKHTMNSSSSSSSSSLGPPKKPARSPSKRSISPPSDKQKPRSKSFSAPTSYPLLKTSSSPSTAPPSSFAFTKAASATSFSSRRARSGSRVEALGRQFEQLMSSPK
ncbi:Rho GTPase activation protein [Hesseltinella vesiculosa]|uniref:Rho GTPase activation protein n=1 Tax=Hesseltinella vesiculosa TaxID=101127 RepID=A0A1X2GTV4_9FUNG|nr:Rho GTPase activation protein [Hesseltinella vesiculosa]